MTLIREIAQSHSNDELGSILHATEIQTLPLPGVSEITGRLLADMHPNGTVRMVFIAHTGGGNEAPLTATNLDAAEIDFVRTCGLTPERAAALRAVQVRAYRTDRFTSESR